MKIVGYIWRVLTKLFYLAVANYALNSLQGRTETLVISALGMIYVTIRTIAWGQFITLLRTNSALQVQLDTIPARLDGTFDSMPAGEIKVLLNTWNVKWIIDLIFLSLISLLCIATFLLGLSKSV